MLESFLKEEDNKRCSLSSLAVLCFGPSIHCPLTCLASAQVKRGLQSDVGSHRTRTCCRSCACEDLCALLPCPDDCPADSGYFKVELCSPLHCSCTNGIGYLQVQMTFLLKYTMAAVNFYTGCHFFDVSVKYEWIVDVNGLF